jgi:non-canonical purine NTP pyrophosphatase (RdgB/HAM1 family)
VDPHKIIRHKLQEALKHHPWPLVIEDTSLYMECLWGKLPWPLIKRFLQELKNEWLYELAKKPGKYEAKATTLIGYAKNADEIEFFEGTVEWRIVEPKNPTDFWRDSIFQPDNHDRPYAAMSREEKNAISMRRMAVNKLKSFLENNR